MIISSPYSPPPPGHDERHHGVDFSYYQFGGRDSIAGVGVQSILRGRISAVIKDSFPCGNFFIIETPYSYIPQTLRSNLQIEPNQSIYLLYAHMEQEKKLDLGMDVYSCQLLGKVGRSGNTEVIHLHLETRIGPAGKTFSSMGYYFDEASAEEKQNYNLWRRSGLFRLVNPMDLLNESAYWHSTED